MSRSRQFLLRSDYRGRSKPSARGLGQTHGGRLKTVPRRTSDGGGGNCS